MHESERSQATKHAAIRWLPWLIGGLGFTVCGLLLRELGARAVWDSLLGLGPCMPLLFALECARFGCELSGTATVLGRDARARMPVSRLLRAQLIAQTLDVLLPAGRASAEAAKAAIFQPVIGLGEAIAAATVLQLAVFLCNAIWAFIGFVAGAGVAMSDALRFGLIAYAVGIGAIVATIVAFIASKLARRTFERVTFLHEALSRFAAMLRERPRAVLWALFAQLCSRAFQAAQVGVLICVLAGKLAFGSGLIGEAVQLIGAALGDLVPAQVGATDGAFVLAAPALGLSAQAALALALALHTVQLFTACVTGLIASFLWWYSSTRGDERQMYELPLQRHGGEREFS